MQIDETAMLTAIRFHGATMNKHDGEIYTLHVARVAVDADMRYHDVVTTSVAWLHDCLEDTELTVPMLAEILAIQQYDPASINEVIAAVVAITKIKGESNQAYYHRVKLNEVAANVKRCDMRDNFRRNHMITDDDTRLRMAAKYSLGMDILG